MSLYSNVQLCYLRCLNVIIVFCKSYSTQTPYCKYGQTRELLALNISYYFITILLITFSMLVTLQPKLTLFLFSKIAASIVRKKNRTKCLSLNDATKINIQRKKTLVIACIWLNSFKISYNRFLLFRNIENIENPTCI